MPCAMNCTVITSELGSPSACTCCDCSLASSSLQSISCVGGARVGRTTTVGNTTGKNPQNNKPRSDHDGSCANSRLA